MNPLVIKVPGLVGTLPLSRPISLIRGCSATIELVVNTPDGAPAQGIEDCLAVAGFRESPHGALLFSRASEYHDGKFLFHLVPGDTKNEPPSTIFWDTWLIDTQGIRHPTTGFSPCTILPAGVLPDGVLSEATASPIPAWPIHSPIDGKWLKGKANGDTEWVDLPEDQTYYPPEERHGFVEFATAGDPFVDVAFSEGFAPEDYRLNLTAVGAPGGGVWASVRPADPGPWLAPTGFRINVITPADGFRVYWQAVAA